MKQGTGWCYSAALAPESLQIERRGPGDGVDGAIGEGGWEGWSWIVLCRGAESKKGIQDFEKELYVCDKCLISERSSDKMLVFCAPVARPVHIWLPLLDPSRSIVDIFAAEVNLVIFLPTLTHCVQVLHAQLNHSIHFIMFFFLSFFLVCG